MVLLCALRGSSTRPLLSVTCQSHGAVQFEQPAGVSLVLHVAEHGACSHCVLRIMSAVLLTNTLIMLHSHVVVMHHQQHDTTSMLCYVMLCACYVAQSPQVAHMHHVM